MYGIKNHHHEKGLKEPTHACQNFNWWISTPITILKYGGPLKTRESLYTQTIIWVKYYHSLNHIDTETIPPYIHQTNMQIMIITNT